MENEILIELASKYARYNFNREEQLVFKAFLEVKPMMSLEEYKRWVIREFDNYYQIIVLMWRGDTERIEKQFLDDYTNLVEFYKHEVENSSSSIISEEKKNLRDLISFAIYFCEYRIHHLTFDKFKDGKRLEEIEFETLYFRDKKEKWLEQYDKLMEDIYSDLTHSE